jgi:hypothetical protein
MIRSCRVCVPCCMVCLGVLLVFGCTKDNMNRTAIGGQVKLDHQPLEEGTIRFMPMQGTKGSMAAGPIVKGQYRLSGKNGAAIGWNRVEIHAMRKTGKKIQKPFPAPQHEMTDETVPAIPPQYNTNSTLKFEVKPGDNKDVNFEVTSK